VGMRFPVANAAPGKPRKSPHSNVGARFIISR
jgi:hypothetical protein